MRDFPEVAKGDPILEVFSLNANMNVYFHSLLPCVIMLHTLLLEVIRRNFVRSVGGSRRYNRRVSPKIRAATTMKKVTMDEWRGAREEKGLEEGTQPTQPATRGTASQEEEEENEKEQERKEM